MAMLTVEGMPPSSASSFWIARVSAGWVTQQRRYPEVADFVYLHGSPFPDDSLASARSNIGISFFSETTATFLLRWNRARRRSAGEGSQWPDGDLREDNHDLAQLRNEPGKFPADVRAVA
ncbi:hypothetical protein, partial [Mesorhizobium sp. M5C.F.Ca.IN.020.29.1.1]|uniref:hypothetical protein n=1 Tax=Mesorhizobium sp. M5C.F.Ca.IN.020.29.1.1 TaxID=2496770 RepID=UPI0019D019C1